MKKILLSFLFASFPLIASAETPLLAVIKGGILRSNGVKRTCEIFANNNAALGNRLDEIRGYIQAASQAPISRAQHVRAEDPSKEIYAFRTAEGREPEKILLLKDESDSQTRDGVAAEALVEIANSICD